VLYSAVLLLIVVGLRTLCVATATVPSDFYETWKMIYYEASTAIRNREQKLEEAAELIEKVGDVTLLVFLGRTHQHQAAAVQLNMKLIVLSQSSEDNVLQ